MPPQGCISRRRPTSTSTKSRCSSKVVTRGRAGGLLPANAFDQFSAIIRASRHRPVSVDRLAAADRRFRRLNDGMNCVESRHRRALSAWLVSWRQPSRADGWCCSRDPERWCDWREHAGRLCLAMEEARDGSVSPSVVHVSGPGWAEAVPPHRLRSHSSGPALGGPTRCGRNNKRSGRGTCLGLALGKRRPFDEGRIPAIRGYLPPSRGRMAATRSCMALYLGKRGQIFAQSITMRLRRNRERYRERTLRAGRESEVLHRHRSRGGWIQYVGLPPGCIAPTQRFYWGIRPAGALVCRSIRHGQLECAPEVEATTRDPSLERAWRGFLDNGPEAYRWPESGCSLIAQAYNALYRAS